MACSVCSGELKKKVGPWGGRLVEVKVLRNDLCSLPSFRDVQRADYPVVLAWVQRGGEDPPAEQGPSQVVFSL